MLPDALRERGAEVDVVALYETVREEPDAGGGRGRRRAPTTSPSPRPRPSRNLTEALGDRFPRGARVVSIGPITSEAARAAGLEVAVEAERHDVEGLIARPRSHDVAGPNEASAPRTGTTGVTDSTNTRARELAEAGAPGGTVVTAARAERGAGPPGPRLDRAAPARRCSTRRSCARSTSATCCCRSPSRSRSARRPRRCGPAPRAGSSGPTTSGSRSASWPAS